MPAKHKSLLFVKEKDTKNTVKFTEAQVQGQAPVVGTLYVQKWFAGAANQKRVQNVRKASWWPRAKSCRAGNGDFTR